jgi:D-amino-acid dehydrogenase
MTAPAAAFPPAHAGETLTILGAGAVGCAAALTFARAGFRVTLIDRGPPGGGASHGNAGGIVPSAEPLAAPGVPWTVPRMLLDPTGPLTIRPAQMLRDLPWFLRFLAECRKNRAEANARALYALSGDAAQAWRDLMRGIAGAELLAETGGMKVASSPGGLKALAHYRHFLDLCEAPYDVLSQPELRQMEPNLGPGFQGGLWQPNGLFARNPRLLTEAVAEAAAAQGARLLTETAEDIDVGSDGRITLITDMGRHTPDRLMLCAGAFSKRFAAKLGAAPRLTAERGYHAMFDIPDRPLTRPVLWMEGSLVICPMQHGTRLTTQSEFGGLYRPPDYTRLDRLTAKAKEMLPGLDITVRERWMGHRPSTPDSLPYLGRAPATPRAYFNFGHNHLGLTLAAVCAETALSDWTEADGARDMTPYRAIR